MDNIHQPSSRIVALDVMRGITIAGMILVNNPGSWGYLYAPLAHAQWNGLTPTDLVFPFFMFIMGMSTYLSLRKYGFRLTKTSAAKVLRRVVGLYLVGLFIVWFSRFCHYWHGNPDAMASDFFGRLCEAAWSFPTIRLTGVLARLAICYGLTAFTVMLLPYRHLLKFIIGLLLFYALLLFGGNGYYYGTEEHNLLSLVDHALLGSQHLYNDNGIDPEGLLSTLPSWAHVLIGFCVGRELGEGSAAGRSLRDKMLFLLLLGGVLTFSGLLLHFGCPINKKIWSPTFVLTTCGMGSTLLALLIYVVDERKKVRWSHFFQSFGVNPLFMYLVSDIVAILLGSVQVSSGERTLSLHGWIYQSMVPVMGELNASLAYALLFLLLCYLMALPLYRRKIYIRL